jgi:YbgC/YbaW family acyl-CoA thioester hydrolase
MSEQDATDKPARKPRKKAAGKSAAKKGRATGRKNASKQKTAEPANAAPAAPDPQANPPASAAEPHEPRALVRVPMPVRWRDLDAFNHVNNSKYLSYLEEARLHWMISVPGQGLDDHVAPVVAAAQLNYRRPIAWPARIVVELFVERLGNTSLTVGHRIVAEDDADTLYCDGHVIMVWIDRESGSAAALPQHVREACS